MDLKKLLWPNPKNAVLGLVLFGLASAIPQVVRFETDTVLWGFPWQFYRQGLRCVDNACIPQYYFLALIADLIAWYLISTIIAPFVFKKKK